MNNQQKMDSLVFFEENGKTYFGIDRAGQFIEYCLFKSAAAYGQGEQMGLIVSNEIHQDSPDDISVEQYKMVVRLIQELLKKHEALTFYSKLYHSNVKFDADDDILDIAAKLQHMKNSYGNGMVY